MRLNALMASVLGLDSNEAPDLAREADARLGPGWEEVFDPLLAPAFSGEGRLDQAFLGRLLDDASAPASSLGALARLLQSTAITLYYSLPQGWEDAGYSGAPLKRTLLHDGLRSAFFPNCNTPCHALMRLVHGD